MVSSLFYNLLGALGAPGKQLLQDSLGGPILEGPISSLGEIALKIVFTQLRLTKGLFLPGFLLHRCPVHAYMSAQTGSFFLLLEINSPWILVGHIVVH